MSDLDTDKLKRLAEDVLENSLPVCAEYALAEAIPALIAENELIEAERSEFKAWFRRASDEINTVTDERDEAGALLRNWLLAPFCAVSLTSVYGDTESFLSRVYAKEPE